MSRTERPATVHFMVGLLILAVVGAGFVLWDRRKPLSERPDMRLVLPGVALATLGAVATFMFWWAIVPPFVLLAGGAMIVHGRHRTRALT